MAPVSFDGRGEGIAIAGGGPVIDKEHPIARAGQHLEVEMKTVAKSAVGSAVDVQKTGIGGRRIGRSQQPALHLLPVIAGEEQPLHSRQGALAQQFVVQPGKLGLFSAGDIFRVEIQRVIDPIGPEKQPIPRHADHFAEALPFYNRRGRCAAVHRHPIDAHLAAALHPHKCRITRANNPGRAYIRRHVHLQAPGHVERQTRGQVHWLAPGCIYPPQPVLGADICACRRACEENRLTVGRPLRAVGAAPGLGQGLHVALRREKAQVSVDLVAVRSQGGDDQQAAAIRRPAHIRVVVAIVGQLAGVLPGGIHQPDVLVGPVCAPHRIEAVDVTGEAVGQRGVRRVVLRAGSEGNCLAVR